MGPQSLPASLEKQVVTESTQKASQPERKLLGFSLVWPSNANVHTPILIANKFTFRVAEKKQHKPCSRRAHSRIKST